MTPLAAIAFAFALIPHPHALGAAGADDKPAKKAVVTKAGLPEFVTFTQDEWGDGAESSGKVAKLLDEPFTKVFDTGLTIGDEEMKKGKSFTFKTGESIKKFLPQRGAPGAMSADTREGAQDAGGLAGEMVAARLNQRFNRHGMLGDSPLEKPKDVELRDLVFDSGVPRSLIGKTVQDVFQMTGRALGGEFGDVDPKKEVIDSNGDGKPDVSLADLRRALIVVNSNFPHGERDEGHLSLPGKPRPASLLDDADLRKKLEEAQDKRDRELDQIDDEHDRLVDKARVDARKSGKPEEYDARRIELERALAAKRMEIVKRYEASWTELANEWHKRHADGAAPAPGERGRDKDKKDKKDKKDGG